MQAVDTTAHEVGIKEGLAQADVISAPGGDTKEGCFMAGQIAGMVKKEQPAAEIVQEIAAEAEALQKGAAKWVK